MQLLEIGIYGHDGQLRRLSFRPGALNVISGLSRTGKSELLKIIDFCAGRRRPELAPGPITEKVAFFAAVFANADGQRVLVVRPQPIGQSSSTAIVEFGRDVSLPPDSHGFDANATTETVRGALDDLLGLGRFDIDQYGGNRERLRASVSHAIQFCLQNQNEFMSPAHLFHRGGEENVAKDFAELFPYFIGAVDEDTVAARRRAAELRRQVRDAERRLEILSDQIRRDQGRERSLLRQAVEAGLIAVDIASTDGDPRTALAALLREPPQTPGDHAITSSPLADLRAEVTRARSVVRELEERRAALRQLDRDRHGHQAALETQIGRLQILDSVGSANGIDDAHCPACGAELEEPDDALAALVADTTRLRDRLAGLGTVGRDIDPAERELEEALEIARQSYRDRHAELNAAIAASDAAARLAEEAQLRARLLGVIEEFLRSSTDTSAAARVSLTERIRTLREEMRALEPALSREALEEELDARLFAMSPDMTSWARRLELEAAERGSVYVDRTTRNVAIGYGGGRINLAQMGSGSNHVGYHLVAHLALHQHFLRQSRPVPHFVVFDQPSLPFFPATVSNKDLAVDDVDWLTVKNMMLLANEVAENLAGGLQVIIIDHASFAGEAWYDSALVEDWHDGTKLVPDDWPTKGS